MDSKGRDHKERDQLRSHWELKVLTRAEVTVMRKKGTAVIHFVIVSVHLKMKDKEELEDLPSALRYRKRELRGSRYMTLK